MKKNMKIIKLKEEYIIGIEYFLEKLKDQDDTFAISAWFSTLDTFVHNANMRLNQINAQLESKGNL